MTQVSNIADIEKAVPMIVAGRTFDNGTICSGEQSIIVTEDRFDDVIKVGQSVFFVGEFAKMDIQEDIRW